MSSSSSSKCVRVTFLIAISCRNKPCVGLQSFPTATETGFGGSGRCRFTSPLALIRAVCSTSPVPQDAWVFHTRSVGGLGLRPAPEAQI